MGKTILDHLSIRLTSVKSGILTLIWDALLRNCPFLWSLCLSRALLLQRSPLEVALLYCRLALSYVYVVARGSRRLMNTSELPTSFRISSGLRSTFPWASTCVKEGMWIRQVPQPAQGASQMDPVALVSRCSGGCNDSHGCYSIHKSEKILITFS